VGGPGRTDTFIDVHGLHDGTNCTWDKGANSVRHRFVEAAGKKKKTRIWGIFTAVNFKSAFTQLHSNQLKTYINPLVETVISQSASNILQKIL